ncbi:DUF2690 domain-containing protein [Streptomyces sp. ISL-12]|uniref:DUF2690 domain-containing protein n=1 Tax=Streptomyces sp. ISL-12 TaxID=2819177 RepID=UPI001BEC6850|nr:DUF2690 domain-containing protein [Streptomyces sp. ISL-12]MBT2411632.1 DUF2690 domain-containing protein [Streptomyces sp. ISL-12]
MSTAHTRLTEALRELRARTGLSLAALAERTAYSKSSWERYLNGKILPPRQAVQELCRIANEPPRRLLALWEITESDRSGRGAVLAPAAPPPGEPRHGTEQPQPAGDRPRSPGRIRLLVALASVYTLLAGGTALLLLLPPARDRAADAAGEPLPVSVPYSLSPRCHGAACEGRDPLRLICGIDPDTLTTSRTATGAYVELRYSETCGASWARTWGTAVGDRLDVTVSGPTHAVRVRDEADADTYVYTGMAAAGPGSTVRACFRPVSADDAPECVTARVGPARSPSPG